MVFYGGTKTGGKERVQGIYSNKLKGEAAAIRRIAMLEKSVVIDAVIAFILLRKFISRNNQVIKSGVSCKIVALS